MSNIAAIASPATTCPPAAAAETTTTTTPRALQHHPSYHPSYHPSQSLGPSRNQDRLQEGWTREELHRSLVAAAPTGACEASHQQQLERCRRADPIRASCSAESTPRHGDAQPPIAIASVSSVEVPPSDSRDIGVCHLLRGRGSCARKHNCSLHWGGSDLRRRR